MGATQLERERGDNVEIMMNHVIRRRRRCLLVRNQTEINRSYYAHLN